MDSVSVIRRMHQHRAWVNAKLRTIAGTLTQQQLHQACPIGQGSIWKTLTHLFAAEYVWLETLLGDEDPCTVGDLPGKLPGNQLGEKPIQNFGELNSLWLALEERWQNYVAHLTPHALDEKIFKRSTSSGEGKRWANSRSDVLLHVCTHAQYTVAQLVNMFRQVGVRDLPDVMLISLARSETSPLPS